MSRPDADAPAWEWPRHPFILEIDTWPWPRRSAREEARPVNLGNVSDRVWDEVAASHFDAVWLMGVWERSPAGIAIALANPSNLATFAAALPDFTTADVVGSPYCIRDYTVDEHLGGTAGLATARAVLARRGVGLVLDFVPNHAAPDHPWTREHPERFVTGTAADLRDDPASFVEVDGQVLANGRDPYFPAWQDVVQLNVFSPSLREAAAETLRTIAEQCDGVRCDMAMLMLNDTFERTWGARAGERPRGEYWPTVIGAVREQHADFRFIAEAYWDLEWALQQHGFDYCYDKRLYDRLLHDGAESVREHLCADLDYQSRLIRFVENHDEPRIASLANDAQHQHARPRHIHPDRRAPRARRREPRPARPPSSVPRPLPHRTGRRGPRHVLQTALVGARRPDVPPRRLEALRAHRLGRQPVVREHRHLVLGRRHALARRGEPERRTGRGPRARAVARSARHAVPARRRPARRRVPTGPAPISAMVSTSSSNRGAHICSVSTLQRNHEPHETNGHETERHDEAS